MPQRLLFTAPRASAGHAVPIAGVAVEWIGEPATAASASVKPGDRFSARIGFSQLLHPATSSEKPENAA